MWGSGFPSVLGFVFLWSGLVCSAHCGCQCWVVVGGEPTGVASGVDGVGLIWRSNWGEQLVGWRGLVAWLAGAVPPWAPVSACAH